MRALPSRLSAFTRTEAWAAWALGIATLEGAAIVFLSLGEFGVYNLRFVVTNLPSGVGPLELSIELTSLSFGIGFVLAVPLGLIRAFGPRMLARAKRGSSETLTFRHARAEFGTDAAWREARDSGLGRAVHRLVGFAAPAVGGYRVRLQQRPAARATLLGVYGALLAIGAVVPRMVGAALLRPYYAFATAYVAVVRGTPFLVQVFVVFYAVIFAYPRFFFLGETVPFWAGLLALTINTTGYQAEALRGGFQSVDATQIDAARALGLRRWTVFRRITLPQTLRLVALPLTNEWISNFKTSAIVSYITLQEVYYWARTDIAAHLARPLEAFVMVAVFYLIVNVTLSRVVTYLERRHRIPGLGYSPLDIEAGVRR